MPRFSVPLVVVVASDLKDFLRAIADIDKTT